MATKLLSNCSNRLVNFQLRNPIIWLLCNFWRAIPACYSDLWLYKIPQVLKTQGTQRYPIILSADLHKILRCVWMEIIILDRCILLLPASRTCHHQALLSQIETIIKVYLCWLCWNPTSIYQPIFTTDLHPNSVQITSHISGLSLN